MKATIEHYAAGRVLIEARPGTGIYRIDMTDHDAADLLSVLEQDKATGRYCDTENGEHTCIMPPGHSVLPHVCRACPREWR